jgi:mannitol-specific phosphotransferase system IIBC component
VNETVVVALVVSFLAPSVLLILQGRQKAAQDVRDAAKEEREFKRRKEERQADEDRADEVAARVEKVATDAAAAQEANAGTLKDIHTLVNSDMTAARTETLAAIRALLVALTATPNADPDEVVAAKARADELEAILADRLVAQRKVEAEAAARAAEPVP